MASKKKTKKKQAKSMRPVGKKVAPMKMAVQKKLTKKTVSPKKKLAAPRKAEVKTKAGGKKTTGGKTAGALQRQVLGKSQSVDTVAFAQDRLGGRSGEQSARGRKRVRGRRGEGRGRRR